MRKLAEKLVENELREALSFDKGGKTILAKDKLSKLYNLEDELRKTDIVAEYKNNRVIIYITVKSSNPKETPENYWFVSNNTMTPEEANNLVSSMISKYSNNIDKLSPILNNNKLWTYKDK